MSREISDEDLVRAAAQIRVADPRTDPGAFESTSLPEAAIWLKTLVGDAYRLPSRKTDEAQARRQIRQALWDAQRIDMLFHGKTFKTSKGKLKIGGLRAWPEWEKAHPELGRPDGVAMMDGFRDADKLNALLWRHFQSSAFTQLENMTRAQFRAPPDIRGAWTGTKALMAQVAKDITEFGKKKVPFISFMAGQDNMLLMEVLDVKQCPWPEPTDKQMELLLAENETKFKRAPPGPLVPMLQTPVFPLIVVRYSYMEGRPKDGSNFMLRLMELVAPRLPASRARAKMNERLEESYRVPEDHLRMLARTLSANADLVDAAYVKEQQSHWNDVAHDVAGETRISFMAPCMRLRWRALEEIDTGVVPKKVKKCHACGKETEKLMCSHCKAVYYCGPDCSKADEPAHKAACKFSEHILSSPDPLPSSKYYVPLRSSLDAARTDDFSLEYEVPLMSGAVAPGDIAPNEYGDARFVVRVGAQGGRPVLWDRRRSLLARSVGGAVPLHAEGHAALERLLGNAQQMHLWAKRVGDCLELDLEDIPPQDTIYWT